MRSLLRMRRIRPNSSCVIGLLFSLLISCASGHAQEAFRFVSGWQLFTFPLISETPLSPCEIVNSPDFALFGLEGDKYLTCDKLGSVLPGQAFWVNLPAGETTFTGTPVDTSRPYPIALSEGWNLIGNPYLVAVSLADARVDGAAFDMSESVGRTAFGWNAETGRYEAATTLEPWKGYFIHSRAAATLELYAAGTAPGGEPQGPTVYSIRIEDAAGGQGAEVGSLDLPPGAERELWAAAYDKDGHFIGNVDAAWMTEGGVEVSAATGRTVSLKTGAAGGYGTLTASFGALLDTTGRVVSLDLSDAAVYPVFADEPVEKDEAGREYAGGQLIVQAAAGTTAERIEEIAAGLGATVVGRNAAAGIYQLKLSGMTASEAAARLSTSAEIAATSPNYYLNAQATPNDTVYGAGAPAERRWGFEKIGMPLVWGEYITVSDPVVAVVDTGVDAGHAELAGRVLAGRNFVDTANPNDTTDVYGHGTPIAGIIAGAGNNGAGIAGMCWNCRILPVKVCTDTGVCPMFSTLNGIMYAADNGARVINLSLGGNFSPGSGLDAIVRTITREAYRKNALLVGAAGNSSQDASTYLPASDRYVMSVGATDGEDQRTTFSNYGLTVDVSAPGSLIYSIAAGGGYTTVSGTSEATAFVSGLAGLIVSMNSGLNAPVVESVITSSADPISTDQPIGGRINVARAVASVTGANQPPVIVSVTPESLFALVNVDVGIVAAVSDPDGDPVTITWAATAGALSATTGANVAWTAPAARGAYRITVTATDANGLTATKEIEIAALDSAAVEMRIEPGAPTVARGDAKTFTAWIYDAAALSGAAAPVQATPVWTLSGTIGFITPEGVLAATNVGTAVVTAQAGGLSASTPVRVIETGNPGLAPAATDTSCGNSWLSEGCNLSRTTVSTLSLNNKKYRYRCVYSTGVAMYGSPLVDSADNAVYVADNAEKVHRINQQTCGLVWQKDLNSGPISLTPAMVDNPALGAGGKRLYVPTDNGRVYALDAATGNELWGAPATATTGFFIASTPVAYAKAAKNRVIFSADSNSSYDGEFIALEDNGATFTQLWRKGILTDYPAAGWLHGSRDTLVYDEVMIATSTPVVYITSFYTGVANERLFAFHADSGDEIWSFATNPTLTTGMFYSPTLVGGQSLYMTTAGRAGTGGSVYKLRASDGAVLWRYTDGTRFFTSSPSHKGGVVYLGTTDRRVAAIQDNVGSASLLWESAIQSGDASSRITARPLAVDNLLVTGSSGGTSGEQIAILNLADGSTFQSYPRRYSISAAPGVAVKTASGTTELYMTTLQGYMVALEENTPPTVTNVTFSTGPFAPGDKFNVNADVNDANSEVNPFWGCSNDVLRNDIYMYPADYPDGTKANKRDVTINLSGIGGSAAVFLYDDGSHGDTNDYDCAYYNKGLSAPNDIQVGLGTAAGVYSLCVTARDSAGETNTLPGTGCNTITVSNATPTIESITFSPTYVHNTGTATSSVSVVVVDPNAAITSVKIGLAPLGGATQTLSCGAFGLSGGQYKATCTYSSITAATSITPAFYNLQVEAYDGTTYVNDASESIEVISLDKFVLSAAPTSLAVPNASTVTISAYDKYNNFMPTWSNLSSVGLSETGGATGTTFTWAGTGVTSYGNGTGRIATGTFAAGVAAVTLANTKAEGPVNVTATTSVFSSTKTGTTTTGITWTAGALGKFTVTALDTAPVVGAAVNVRLLAYDAYNNFISTYTNAAAVTLSQSGAATGTSLTWAGTGVTNNGDGTGALATGGFTAGAATVTLSNTVAEGPVRAIATDSGGKTGNTGDTSTDITWALGAIDHFDVVAAPTSLATGASTTVTITARDSGNFLVNNFNKTVNITHALVPAGSSATLTYAGTGVTDGGAGSATLDGTAFTGGVATFTSRNTTASQTVRFTVTYTLTGSTGNTGTSGTDVTWNAGALDHFTVTAAPTSLSVGATSTITIRAYDAYNNLISAYTNAAAVNLTQSGAASGSTLTWAGTGVTNNGDGTGSMAVGTFAAGAATATLRDSTADAGVRATVTDSGGKTGHTGTTGTDMTWAFGALDHFTVTAAPFNGLAAGASSTVTVTAYDSSNSIITNFASAVNITHALIPAGLSTTLRYAGTGVTDNMNGTASIAGAGFASGTATFTVRNTMANQEARFTAREPVSGVDDTTGTTFTDVDWVAGALDYYTLTAAPTSLVITNASTITIRAYDEYDNFINTYTNAAAVNLTQSGAAAGSTLTWASAGVTNNGDGTGSIGIGGFAAGIATVTLTNTAAEGPVRGIATDSGGKTGSTNDTGTNITWTFGPLDHFEVVAAPTSGITVGDFTTLTVTVYDTFSNIVLDFNDNVNISQTGGTGAKIDYTGAGVTDNGNGTAQLAGTSFASGVVTFQATDFKASETVRFQVKEPVTGKTGDTSLPTVTDVTWDPDVVASLKIQENICSAAGAALDTYTMQVGTSLTMCAAGWDQYDNYVGAVSSDWCVDDGSGWCGGSNTLDPIAAGPADTNTFTPMNKSTQGYIHARAQAVPAATDLTGLIRVQADEPRPPTLSALGEIEQIRLRWATPTKFIDGTSIPGALQAQLTYNIWYATAPGIDCDTTPSSLSAGPATTTYLHTGVTPWVRYYYRMSAVSPVSGEESACTGEVSAIATKEAYRFRISCGDESPVYLPPSDLSQYSIPMDADVDPAGGFIFVVERDNHRVKKIDFNCTYIDHWGGYGETNGRFLKPTGVAFANNEVYVTDSLGRVQVFSDSGTFRRSWSVPLPLDVDVGPDGLVYVTSEQDQVRVYDSVGVLQRIISMIMPRNVTVDSNYIYVTDGWKHNVTLYNLSGDLEKTIGGPGKDYGEFNTPYGIALNSSGQMLVADGYRNDRIQVINADGSTENVLGPKHTDYGYMNAPLGIAAGPNDEAVVVESFGGRILIFDPPPP